jgi:hypothetical protein
MLNALRRSMPIVVLCLATFLGGCVVVPARPAYWGPGWHYGYGYGYGWRR